MIQVYPGVCVGTVEDYESLLVTESNNLDSWAFVLAARDPYHRKEVGWTGRGCPKDNPEYLTALRHDPERIVLNMLDGKSAEWIPDSMVFDALAFALYHYSNYRKLMFVCNQGHSRGPGLSLAFMRRCTDVYGALSYEQAKTVFTKIYPNFLPGPGVDQWLSQYWEALICP